MEKQYNIKEIMDVVPHRYPFILIDRVVEVVPNERATALKNVTINEPFFQGHFPTIPIMPGVLIMEAMAQTGCVLGYASSFQEKGGLMFFAGMDKVKFRKPVVPGDQLIIEVKVLKLKSKLVKLSGTAKVDGKLVAEAELLAFKGEAQ